jgi:hypothetical protein
MDCSGRTGPRTFCGLCGQAGGGELETADIALLAKMGEMLQVMEESIAFGLSGIKSRSGLTGGSAKILQAVLARKTGTASPGTCGGRRGHLRPGGSGK